MKKILIMILIILSLTGCGSKDKTKDEQIKQETKTNIIENTSWIAKDNSEIIFAGEEVHWYQTKSDYDDNYYYGKYNFYIGEDAIKFITVDLKDYGVTKSELEKIFEQSEKYNKDTFVVIDLIYESLTMNGKESTPTTPHAPWFGFILDENTLLDVANMNTGTYYNFKLNSPTN